MSSQWAGSIANIFQFLFNFMDIWRLHNKSLSLSLSIYITYIHGFINLEESYIMQAPQGGGSWGHYFFFGIDFEKGKQYK